MNLKLRKKQEKYFVYVLTFSRSWVNYLFDYDLS